LKILEEVYKVKGAESKEEFQQRPLYNRTNQFFKSTSVADLIAELPDEEQKSFSERKRRLNEEYAKLSQVYQSSKGKMGIPLA